MVTLKQPRTLETPANPKQTNSHEQPQTPNSEEILVYEQLREKKIRENMERMKKLGLFHLSSKFKSEFPSSKRKSPNKTPRPRVSPLQSSLPKRRSSRLENSPSINYSESKKDQNLRLMLEGISTPVINTEKYKKLPSSYESSRALVVVESDRVSGALVVEGSGTGGKRICDRGKRVYDQVNGKTCHQCRQKTLACVTHCNQCTLVTGQFCGDCLFLRYGEHVLEVNEDPNWICPFCRGICNCSLCRSRKGLPAIGALARSIKAMGFKSVHHYLIQDRVPAKRALPFEDTEQVEEPSKDLEDAVEEEKKGSLTSDDDAVNNFSDVNGDELRAEKQVSKNNDGVSDVNGDDSMNEGDGVISDVVIDGGVSEVKPDSIARRLRPREKKTDANPNLQTPKPKKKEEMVENVGSGSEAKRRRKSIVKHQPDLDSIGARLRQRRSIT